MSSFLQDYVEQVIIRLPSSLEKRKLAKNIVKDETSYADLNLQPFKIWNQAGDVAVEFIPRVQQLDHCEVRKRYHCSHKRCFNPLNHVAE